MNTLSAIIFGSFKISYCFKNFPYYNSMLFTLVKEWMPAVALYLPIINSIRK